jgi:serine/threonine protein kinase
MGVIYLAKDPFIGRPVAIKVTLEPPPQDPKKLEEFQQVFFNEVQAAGKLIHPHIVSVYDATVEEDCCYLVMEYVDGSSLEGYCKKENLLPLDKVIKIIFQCAKALDYAHQNDVVHRDVKPANILISTKGEAKISDFGIAMVKGDSGLSQPGSLTGSLYYASPEQLRGEELTLQTDLFSLGVVMYEMLTGAKPFRGDTDVSTIYKINNEAPEPFEDHQCDVPESLERIIARALEKDPKQRYQSGLQLASELSASFDHLRFLDEEINFEEKYNSLKQIDFFKDFTSSELAEVLKATQWVKYEGNSTIITEGEIEDCFYIIIVGEVMVKKQGKPLTMLEKGDCFGEMAYLGRIERTATIKAIKDTILMKVNASIIDQTSINTQLCFYKVFTTTLIHRLIYTSELLSKGPL